MQKRKIINQQERIINGQDKDWIIAEYAQGIEECLMNAKIIFYFYVISVYLSNDLDFDREWHFIFFR